jgi:hypothetical protein
MAGIIYLVNVIVLFFILRYQSNSDNDKSIILSSIAFLVVLMINVLCEFFAQLDKKKVYRHFYYSALGLLLSGIIALTM